MASRATARVSPSERLAFRAKEVAELLGISERKLREIQHALPRVVIGRVVLFPRRELEAWLAGQASAAAESSGAVEAVLRDITGSRGS